MTTKQFLKILSIIGAICATIGIFIPMIKYQTSSNFNCIKLVSLNGKFQVGIFFLILFTVFSLLFSLMSLSLDTNKIIPIIIIVTSLFGAILGILTKNLILNTNKSQWQKFAKLTVGGYMCFIGLFISFISQTIVTFRNFILKKTDDLYYVKDDTTSDEENEEAEEENSEENNEENDIEPKNIDIEDWKN